MQNINEKFIEICNLLNDLNFHDSQSIEETLKISSTTVNYWIKKLQSYGIEVGIIEGKSYSLKEPLILLDLQKIKNLLQFDNLNIHIVESIDSTNNYFKEAKKSSIPQICIAEHQTGGKGRLAREWYSPFGKNIYFSLRYSLAHDISSLGSLSLVISTIVCKTLEKACKLPENLQLKWPNDIMYHNKKLAGMLIQTRTEMNGNCTVIIGIGINVNILNTNSPNFQQEWISLRHITGKYYDRNHICAALTDKLIAGIETYLIKGFEYYLPDWVKRDNLSGKIIKINDGNEIYVGKAKGVDIQGHLIMELENGQQEAFAVGEATVMKENG